MVYETVWGVTGILTCLGTASTSSWKQQKGGTKLLQIGVGNRSQLSGVKMSREEPTVLQWLVNENPRRKVRVHKEHGIQLTMGPETSNETHIFEYSH
jgi:hypothetical protein